jgi:hypothetical protein
MPDTSGLRRKRPSVSLSRHFGINGEPVDLIDGNGEYPVQAVATRGRASPHPRAGLFEIVR